MQDLVEQVLSDRRRRAPPRGFLRALAWAALLHLGVLGAFLLAGSRPASKPFEFVPVQVLPLQALGSPKPPRPAPSRAADRTTPPTVTKPPEAPPKPKELVKPSPTPPVSKPQTAPVRPDPPVASPAPRVDAEQAPSPGDDATRRGSAHGHEAGTAALGSTRLEGVDPDFTYDYYLDRMLALISDQWTRPSTQGEVRAVLRFVVQKNGTIEELELAEGSGFTAFDLSALRAVQNASPLPRLPASYKKGTLRVTLIVR